MPALALPPLVRERGSGLDFISKQLVASFCLYFREIFTDKQDVITVFLLKLSGREGPAQLLGI